MTMLRPPVDSARGRTKRALGPGSDGADPPRGEAASDPTGTRTRHSCGRRGRPAVPVAREPDREGKEPAPAGYPGRPVRRLRSAAGRHFGRDLPLRGATQAERSGHTGEGRSTPRLAPQAPRSLICPPPGPREHRRARSAGAPGHPPPGEPGSAASRRRAQQGLRRGPERGRSAPAVTAADPPRTAGLCAWHGSGGRGAEEGRMATCRPERPA